MINSRIGRERVVFIGTLGTEPQVITLSLFYLKDKLKVRFDEIAIIRTSIENEKIYASVKELKKFFRENKDFKEVSLHFIPVKVNGKEIMDITNEQESLALFDTVFNLIRKYKHLGYRIELVIAGGRKPMSIYPVVSAGILFEDDDRIWHLLSSESLVKSRNLIPEKTDFYKLVPIPVMKWSPVSPVLVVDGMSPQEFLEEKKSEITKNGVRQYRHFLSQLTDIEEKVFELLIKGLSNKEIANRLGKSSRTVEHQVQSIYGKFKVAFGLPVERKITRQKFVTEILKYRYSGNLGNSAHDKRK